MEKRTRIAAIIIQDGKILFVKGKGFSELWTPGGKLEAGESEEACLRRELQEEISAEVSSFNFFREYLGKSFYNPNLIVKQKIYLVSVTGKIKPANEIESFVWLSKEDFLKKKFPLIPITENEIIPELIKQGFF